MNSMDPHILRVCLKLFEALDTPRSQTCYMLCKAGEWDQLANLRLDPSAYLDAFSVVEKFRRDYQATELLRKFEPLPTTVNREEVTISAFWETERRNKVTNDRLDALIDSQAFLRPIDEAYLRVTSRAQAWISKVLGRLPDSFEYRFGKGSTFESPTVVTSHQITLMDKLSSLPTCTEGIVPFQDALLRGNYWGKTITACHPGRPIPVVRGNRFSLVNKDCTKKRGICIEPGLNIWAQLGVGHYLKGRLRKFNLDLARGQDLHRRLARQASRDGSYVTIDLSNASDTICWKLVKLLLPSEWYGLLDSWRSPMTRIEKRGKNVWVKLEKFSSMGNGFTFELETLIFTALAVGLGYEPGVDFWCYGDDMIATPERVGDLLAVLSYSGFEINRKKTFRTSAFRESCGGDFFEGVDVRPYYLKEDIVDASGWISFCNGLYARSSKRAWLDPWEKARRACEDNIPTAIRSCRGPVELGDLVIHDIPKRWNGTWRSCVRWIRVWRPVARKIKLERWGPDTILAGALYGASSEGVTPRNEVEGFRFGRVAFS